MVILELIWGYSTIGTVNLGMFLHVSLHCGTFANNFCFDILASKIYKVMLLNSD